MPIAKIFWIESEVGGKKQLPGVNENFYPMLKLDSYNESMNWSLVLKNIQFINNHETISEVDFIMKNAPHELLSKGSNFELYEGNHLVARGRIE